MTKEEELQLAALKEEANLSRLKIQLLVSGTLLVLVFVLGGLFLQLPNEQADANAELSRLLKEKVANGNRTNLTMAEVENLNKRLDKVLERINEIRGIQVVLIFLLGVAFVVFVVGDFIFFEEHRKLLIKIREL